MSKVRRKTNSFATALQDAAKRYAKATKEREVAVIHLAELNDEIPALERTMAALKAQLGQEPTPQRWQAVNVAPIAQLLPERFALPENLTEDDTLPEPDGQPLTPEE